MPDEHCSAQWLRNFIRVHVLYCMYIYPCAVPSLNKDVTYLLTSRFKMKGRISQDLKSKAEFSDLLHHDSCETILTVST